MFSTTRMMREAKRDVREAVPYELVVFATKKAAAQMGDSLEKLLYVMDYREAFAFSTRAAKAAGSWIAISDRLLRFISMPDFLTPFMNLE